MPPGETRKYGISGAALAEAAGASIVPVDEEANRSSWVPYIRVENVAATLEKVEKPVEPWALEAEPRPTSRHYFVGGNVDDLVPESDRPDHADHRRAVRDHRH